MVTANPQPGEQRAGMPQLLTPLILWSLDGDFHWSKLTKICEQESQASASKTGGLLGNRGMVEKHEEWRKLPELYFTAGSWRSISRETESSSWLKLLGFINFCANERFWLWRAQKWNYCAKLFFFFNLSLRSAYLETRKLSSSHFSSLCHFPFMLPDGFNKIIGQMINTYRPN